MNGRKRGARFGSVISVLVVARPSAYVAATAAAAGACSASLLQSSRDPLAREPAIMRSVPLLLLLLLASPAPAASLPDSMFQSVRQAATGE